MKNNLTTDWNAYLFQEVEKLYFKKLLYFLNQERKLHKIYPPENLIFSAFKKTSPKNLKVIILGQDPYYKKNQANGLSFSVQNGVKIPPSLKNILTELKCDINCKTPNHGNLEHWANQGVLLLNSCLTVRDNKPGSHQKIGWEIFTNKVIEIISNNFKGIVFILWGSSAKKKAVLIDQKRHFIISSSHPSPFSARRGFFGSKPFSKCNEYLESVNKVGIDWDLTKYES